MARPAHTKLSDTERMDRIGELLCEAVMLAAKQQEVEPVPPKVACHDESKPADVSGYDPEGKILNQIEDFIREKWRVSPSQIQVRFGLKRTTLHYKLKTLLEEDRIQKEGGGRSTRYKMKHDKTK